MDRNKDGSCSWSLSILSGRAESVCPSAQLGRTKAPRSGCYTRTSSKSRCELVLQAVGKAATGNARRRRAQMPVLIARHKGCTTFNYEVSNRTSCSGMP
jgi:hypothetical protein